MAGGLSRAVPGRHCHLGLSHGSSPGAGERPVAGPAARFSNLGPASPESQRDRKVT